MQAGLKEAEEPEIKLPTFIGSWRKQGCFRKMAISTSLTMLKPLTVWITTNWKILKRNGNTRPPCLPPEKPVCGYLVLSHSVVSLCTPWTMKQQLELDTEQLTGSKSGKEYDKAVCCHPAYLTYLQSTSCEILGWMSYKLESRLLGEMSTISDMQVIPL